MKLLRNPAKSFDYCGECGLLAVCLHLMGSLAVCLSTDILRHALMVLSFFSVRCFLSVNPDLLSHHGSFSRDELHDPRLVPQFVLSKYQQSGQLLMTPLEAFSNHTSRIPWEDRTIDKVRHHAQLGARVGQTSTDWRFSLTCVMLLCCGCRSQVFWRGSTTGDSFSK